MTNLIRRRTWETSQWAGTSPSHATPDGFFGWQQAQLIELAKHHGTYAALSSFSLGVQDVAGYKRAGGNEPMPRSLLLIDEFQEFFVEDDRISQAANVLLDRGARNMAGLGIVNTNRHAAVTEVLLTHGGYTPTEYDWQGAVAFGADAFIVAFLIVLVPRHALAAEKSNRDQRQSDMTNDAIHLILQTFLECRALYKSQPVEDATGIHEAVVLSYALGNVRGRARQDDFKAPAARFSP